MKKYFLKLNKLITSILLIGIISIGYFIFFNKNIQTASAGWWNDAWSYRKAITINHTQVVGDLANFPMLISLTDTSLGSKAQEDGNDIIFIDSEGKKLSHEIESFATSTGVLVAWVKIPTLSSTVDEEVHMYYGNQSVDNQQDVENVWDSNYKMIQHLNEGGTGTRYDSTANNNDGTTSGYDGDEATTTGAKIGGADDFDGTNDYIDAGDHFQLNTGGHTICAWIKMDATQGATFPEIVSKSNGTDLAWDFYTHGTGKLGLSVGDGAGGYVAWKEQGTIGTATLRHVCGTYNGGVGGAGSISLYIDGVLQSGESAGGTGTRGADENMSLWIGSDYKNQFKFNGIIDEVRVSNTVRSVSWIQTSYNNQNNPSLFLTPQAEEVGPGPVGYWSFNEGYGSTAHDESSGKKNGTITGAIWQDESMCVSGKCLGFDGSDDRLTISNFQFPIFNQFSISQFFNVQTLATGDSIISQWGGSQNNILVKLDDTNSDELKICLASGLTDNCANYGITSALNLEANKWYNLQIIYNGTQGTDAEKLKVYIDSAQKSLSFGGTIPATIQNSSTADLEIGGNSNLTSYLNARIDEIKIYPYARTADQVKQDYASGKAGISTPKGTAVSFGGSSDSWMSDGLVGYWKMDESATTTGAIDSSGNGNTGTYYNTASTAGGKFGRGGVFDGDSDYISTSKAFDSIFTYTGWIKISSIPSVMYTMVGSSDVGGPLFGIYSNQKLILQNAGMSTLGYSTDVVPLNVWTNITVTYNESTGDYIFYINGEPSGRGNQSVSFTLSRNLYIGSRYGSSLYFNGNIDEVRIYNRALSKSEVKKLYEWAPGPVLHLKMDEKTGVTANDLSGYGNNGTLGGNGVGSDLPGWDRGMINSALNFDGSDDYVSISHSSDFLTKNGTVQFWFNARGVATRQGLFSKDSSSFDNGGHLTISIEADASLMARIQDTLASYDTQTSASYIQTDKWYFLSYVFGENGSNLFVDGISVATNPYIGGLLGNAEPLALGAASWTSGDEIITPLNDFFAGKIDDVRIYNYARTQKQILEDMHNGNPMKGAMLDLSFDEGMGDTAYDKSVFKNNGTLQPGTSGVTATSAMWSMNGKYGGAVEFDMVDDYIDLGGEIIGDKDMWSISAWIKPDATSTSKTVYGEGHPSDQNAIFFGIDNNTDEIKGSVKTQDGTWHQCYGTVIDDNWHHVVFLQRSDTDRELYVDGYSVCTDSGDAGIFTLSIATIGALSRNIGVGSYFGGSIDEVKIYPYALNEEEILKDYNMGQAAVVGEGVTSNNNGATVTGASTKYCVPGDTSPCAAPVLELKMDEKTGGTVYDTSGNGNDGTLVNDPAWARGKYGSALDFDGSDDYVNIGRPSVLDFGSSSSYTIEWWYNPKNSSNKQIIGKTGGEDSRIHFYHSGGSLYRWASFQGPSISDNEGWIHISYIYTADGENYGTEKFYKNGILSDERTGSMPNWDYISDWRLGGSDSWMINSVLDDVRIYNYARTPAQIAWDYNRGKPIAEWRFDECAGSTIHDESGNGNHGTASSTVTLGTCASSSDSFWFNGKDGKRNSSGSFDGSDDYVNIDSSVGDFNVQKGSISAWVKRSFTDSVGEDKYVFDVYYDNGNYHRIYYDSIDDQWDFFIYRAYTLNSVTATASVIPQNEWTHVLMTWDEYGDDVSVYINGVNIGSDSSGGLYLETPITARIGAERGNRYEWEGLIDEVKIWNYALTAEQVKNDYSGGAVSFGQ